MLTYWLWVSFNTHWRQVRPFLAWVMQARTASISSMRRSSAASFPWLCSSPVNLSGFPPQIVYQVLAYVGVGEVQVEQPHSEPFGDSV